MKNTGFSKNDYAASLAFIAYSSSVAITPICLLKLMEELSFSMAGGGGIEVVRTALVVVVLLLSGFAAARWGKSKTLIGGSLLLAVGMAAYALAPAYIVVLSAMIFVGLGGGIIEGLINPLVQDAHPDDSGKYLNIVNAFWSIGVLSSVLISGMLLTRGVSWRFLMAGSSVLGFLSALLFYAFREKKPAAVSPNEAAKTRRAGTAETWRLTKEILKTKRFRAFAAAMFTGAGAEAAFTFWSASYLQIHFGTLPRAGGFGTAFFAAGMIAGRMLSGHYVKQENLRTLILVSATAGIAASIFAFLVSTIGGFYVCLFVAGLTVACFWPSIQSYAADCLNVDHTMLFILMSCAGIPGFGFASWIMGIIGSYAGIRAGFAAIPVFFILLFFIILIDHKKNRVKTQ